MRREDLKVGQFVRKTKSMPHVVGNVVESYTANDGKVIVQIAVNGRESMANVVLEDLEEVRP